MEFSLKKPPLEIVLTCEHASNHIPKAYKHLIPQNILSTHSAYDIGVLGLIQNIHRNIPSNIYLASISRLVIDMNRSLTNRHTLFSPYTQQLTYDEKKNIIEQYYLNYRQPIENKILKLMHSNYHVWHLSIHSFTPVFNHIKRNADIGLLYNPQSFLEKQWAHLFKTTLHTLNPNLIIRMNYPYLGISDSLTQSFRKKINTNNYVGIEIEMNQKYFLSKKQHFPLLEFQIIQTLNEMQSIYSES